MTAMSDVFEAICVRVSRETEQTDKQCLYDVCVLRKEKYFKKMVHTSVEPGKAQTLWSRLSSLGSCHSEP